MSEKIDEENGKEIERKAQELLRKIREVFGPIVKEETTFTAKRFFVDEEDAKGKSRDELIYEWDAAEGKLAAEEERRRTLEVENDRLKDKLENASHSTIERMYELCEERIEKERLESGSRMKSLVESLRQHRNLYDAPDGHTFPGSFQNGYAQALDMVIEILGLEASEKLGPIYEWFNRHQNATPAGPKAPQKGPCEGCEEIAAHGDAACEGCFYKDVKIPLVEKPPKPVEKVLKTVSVKQLIEDMPEEEDDEKPLVEKPTEKITEFNLTGVHLHKEACPGNGIWPIEKTVEETCEACSENDVCKWWKRRENLQVEKEQLKSDIEPIREAAGVSIEEADALADELAENERLQSDIATLEKNLGEPIRLDAETEITDERPMIRITSGQLSEEDRKTLQDLIDKEIIGPSTPLRILDSTLAEAPETIETGKWVDDWPQPAPILGTYRLAYRKNSLDGIFRVLIDADYGIRIGTDLNIKPVSRESFEEGSEGGKWWSDSMVIPSKKAD
jgi:hypothetical protein